MKSTNESAKFLPLVRVEYVNPYVSALRKMGVPVERELRRARLPGLIEELSNQYVSTNLAYKCQGVKKAATASCDRVPIGH